MRSITSRWPWGAAALAALLSGCAGEQTGSLSPLGALPAEVPRITGLERPADREHAQLIAAFGGEYRAPEAQRLLTEIATRLVPATERPAEAYQITLLSSPVPNAFALPSGRLYVTRGLLAFANDTAEVAAVLAHEIAHVTVRHALARNELELRSALVSRVVSDVLNDPVAEAMVRNQSRVSMPDGWPPRGDDDQANRLHPRQLRCLCRAARPGQSGA